MSTVAIFCIILGVIIILGIIDYISDIRQIGENQQFIIKFRDVSLATLKKVESNKKADNEIFEVMSTYQHAQRILRKNHYSPSAYSIMTAIQNGNQRDLHNEVVCLNEEVVSTCAEFDRDRRNLIRQCWNLFNYFFRGVGLLLKIVFGYPIQMIKPSFDFKSKGWNTFCAIVGLAGSVASIIALFLR